VQARPNPRPETIRLPPSAPTSRPRVSIVVPSYNYAHYLPACIDSVVGQVGVEVDVLIIDDCSTDDTPAVTARLTERYPNVRVIRHEVNRGHIATYNEGLLQIDGTYSMLLSADDRLPAGALARATALMEAHPGVGFVYGRPVHFSDEPPARHERGRRPRSWSVWTGHDWIAHCCGHGYNVVSNPEVVMRTAVMQDAGGLKAELPHTGDLELWLQIAARADVGRVNGPAQGYYRVHAKSMQRTVYSGVLTDLQGRIDAFDHTFAGPAGALADAGELAASAHRAIAVQAIDRACRAYDRGRTGELDVDALVAFARRVWPEGPALEDQPAWAALEHRQRVGPERAPRVPSFVAGALLRRAVEDAKRVRWQHTGVQ
jgi:hypothetical protein